MRLTPESAGLCLLFPWTIFSKVFPFQHVPAQWLLMLLLGFGFDILLSFTLSFQWLSFYESILWFPNKIPIGFLFSIDCVAPNSNSLCAKELKGFGFPHWPPRVPHAPYSLSLQMVELSIYPTEHCRAAHPSPGYLVKQLQPHLGNRILMDPSCASAYEHHGSPQWSHHLPISILSLDLSDTPERTKLHSASPILQGNGERDRSSLPFPLSLSSSAAGRSGAFLACTHWFLVLNLCQWYASSVLWPHITQTCGAIYSFLRYFVQKLSLF